MNILGRFSVVVDLKLFNYLKKKNFNLGSTYSKIKLSNFCNQYNFEPRYKTKTISKIESPCTFTKTKIDSYKINGSIGLHNKESTELYCKRKDSVSVAIIGGGCATIYLAVLLKQNPAIKEIHVIDMDNSLSGPIYDIGQIDTSTVIAHYKKNSIADGLNNIDIVALMDETNFSMGDKGPFYQFESSSNYVKSIAERIINICPEALIAVFTHPVTATLPLISEINKLCGNWNPNKIIGSAALESMRISSITANLLQLNPSFLSIPITGGIDSSTVVPLLSKTKQFNCFSTKEQCILIHQLRSIDKHLHDSETKGSTLSSGLAAAKFISTLINGLRGQSVSIASAYVRSDIFPFCHYMTSELKFGPNGIEHNFGIPKVNSNEILLIEEATIMINKIVNSVTHFINTGIIK